MLITFNTKRLYTNEGQVITAQYVEETGMIHFNDHSRMCNGSFKPLMAPSTPYGLAEMVMRKYDRLGAQWTAESASLRRQPDIQTIQL